MGFNINDFKNNAEVGGGFARSNLFEVFFHNLDNDAEVMKFLCGSVERVVTPGEIRVGFEIYEREDQFVTKNIEKLAGPITIREHTPSGHKYLDTKYEFKFEEAYNELNWGAANTDQIKKWRVMGTLTLVDDKKK